VARIRDQIGVRLNLEMAATDEMVAIARELKPDLVTLVPEQPGEVTTEGGLDLIGHGKRIWDACGELQDAGVEVSLFLDPAPRILSALEDPGRHRIRGFEINTDLFARLYSRQRPQEHEAEAGRIRAAAEAGRDLSLEVYAGHGLTTDNVGPIAALPEIEELNIGHSIVSRAVLVGMREAVQEMLRAMAHARASGTSTYQ
jgi:pyridoxine 5-phosphate synthase